MSLPPRRPASDDWSAEIAADARTEMKARVGFFDPTADAPGGYDPLTDSKGGAPVLLFGTIARIQHLRWANDASTPEQWGTQRAMRLQIPLDTTTTLIRKGLVVRVVFGGKDAALEQIAFQVSSAINSSSAAVRTVECISALAAVPPLSDETVAAIEASIKIQIESAV